MSDKHEAEPGFEPERPDASQRKGALTSRDEPLAAKEIGGRSGPEPTRFGDWEKNGRCIDF